MAEFEGVRLIGDALGKDSRDFYPELSRMDAEALIGSTFVIEAAKLVDWDYTNNESGQFALAKIKTTDGKEYTTILGGRAVTRQVKKIINLRKLPVVAFLNLVSGPNGDYRVLQNPPVEEAVSVS